jgi:prefoldin subunit 5
MAPRKKSKNLSREAKAIEELKAEVKQLDLQIRKVRRAIEKLPPWHFKSGGPTWSFGPGDPFKKGKRK